MHWVLLWAQIKIPAHTGAHTLMDEWVNGWVGGWVDRGMDEWMVDDCIDSTEVTKLLFCARQCEWMGGTIVSKNLCLLNAYNVPGMMLSFLHKTFHFITSYHAPWSGCYRLRVGRRDGIKELRSVWLWRLDYVYPGPDVDEWMLAWIEECAWATMNEPRFKLSHLWAGLVFFAEV